MKSFNSTLLNEPHTVSTKAGKPCKVYTPYFKNVKDRPVEPPVEPRLDALNFPKIYPNSESLEAIGLMPKKNWHRGFVEHWEPTEAAALEQLDRFLQERVIVYDSKRDFPEVDELRASLLIFILVRSDRGRLFMN